MSTIVKLCLVAILFSISSPETHAQQPIGRCFDQKYGRIYDVLPNLYAYQVDFPMNNGQAFRDPSGIFFLRMPAANPFMQAYFVTWDMRILELNMGWPAPIVIGYCQFAMQFQPPPPPDFNFNPSQNHGVILPQGGTLPVPQQVAQQAKGLAPPRIASEADAQACMDKADGNEEKFAECMLPKMLSNDQIKAYKCAKAGDGDEMQIGACLAKQLVGDKEGEAIDKTMQCYKQHGDDYKKYPLCMAGDQYDPKVSATVNCIADRAESGEVSAWVVAGCAAGSQLGMNAEMAIAVECAMSTGGQPYAFAGCTAGRLTQRELTKCFTDGVGGDGCFGPNNDIVKGLKAVGLDLSNLTNPNGEVIKAWNTAVNDLQNGPGKNNDIVKAIDGVNEVVQNAPQQVVEEVKNVAEKFGLGGLL